VLAGPVAGGCLIFRGFAVVSGPEISPTLRVLVFREIAVITMSIRDFLDFVTFLA
jgi:hypothetical protein